MLYLRVKKIVITLGATSLTYKEPGVLTLTSSTKIVHPLYNSNLIINDIALIKLPNFIKTPTCKYNLS
jgi:hypothetical protein